MFLVLVTAISLSQANAIEVALDSPEKVDVEEEFTVEISTDTQETSDVKIFVHNSEDDKISREEYLSEIFDEGDESWKDSYFYVQEAFPENSKFDIRVLRSPGDATICLRLRNSASKNGFEQVCNPIEILESEDAKKEESTKKASPTKQEQTTQTVQQLPLQQPIQQAQETSEKITLNANPSPKQTSVIETKESQKTKIIIYSFGSFCILLIVLLALRRL